MHLVVLSGFPLRFSVAVGPSQNRRSYVGVRGDRPKRDETASNDRAVGEEKKVCCDGRVEYWREKERTRAISAGRGSDREHDERLAVISDFQRNRRNLFGA